MSDNIGYTPGTGATVAADNIGGVLHQRVKIGVGVDGAAVDVSASNPMPVTGSVTATGPLTDAELRAAAVPVSGPLTDAQLRAAAVPVSAAALPLPIGAATETTLAALNAKIPAAGQTTMAGSQPVVIASNQTAVPTLEAATILTGAAAQTAVVNNILENPSGAAGTNAENLRSASVQVVSTGTGGTFIFEQSNDNTNWIALPVFNAALVTGVPITAAITATASQIIYTFPLRCRFIRLRIATLITGGSIQAFSRLSGDAWTPAVYGVAQPTAANLNATVSGTVTANIGTGALAAGTNLIGDVGIQVRANATGAASIHHFVAAATTNALNIKASAGRVFGWSLANTTASWRYLKLHNTAGAPTAGAGVVQTIGIPPNGLAQCSIPQGLGFATGIARTCVTGAADTDATATGANDVVGDIFFA